MYKHIEEILKKKIEDIDIQSEFIIPLSRFIENEIYKPLHATYQISHFNTGLENISISIEGKDNEIETQSKREIINHHIRILNYIKYLNSTNHNYDIRQVKEIQLLLLGLALESYVNYLMSKIDYAVPHIVENNSFYEEKDKACADETFFNDHRSIVIKNENRKPRTIIRLNFILRLLGIIDKNETTEFISICRKINKVRNEIAHIENIDIFN